MHPFALRPMALLVTSLTSVTTFLATPTAFAADGSNRDSNSETVDVTPSTSPEKAADPKQETLVVTAERFRRARIELSPSVGTTIYTIGPQLIDSLGQGSATAFDDVLLRLPGVTKDSKASGSVHVRDDHGNIQYRINGVQLPESISGFGQSIDTRFVAQIDYLTGALPAQYGLRAAGVVDIQTKEGAINNGGRIEMGVGSNNIRLPSLQLFGSSGALSYYLSGSYLSSDAGIENPLPTKSPMHDRTTQTKSFGDFSYYLNDSTRVGLLFGTYNGKFQIPVNPNQNPAYSLTGISDVNTGLNKLPSSQVDERQNEVNRFYVLSVQRNLDKFDFQLSSFYQYSNLHFFPDQRGDLIYNGVASNTLRSNAAMGLQLDSAYKWKDDHTIRFGFAYTRQTTHSDNTVQVFPIDAAGVQAASDPLTIIDNSAKLGRLTSAYLQDEWRFSQALTVNYGGRYDQVSAFINEQQLSPRINIAYKLSDTTGVHAGYSRYFTPPPQELASQSRINLYSGTTNQPEIANSDNVKAERTHYYDIGVSKTFGPNLTMSLDAYYKRIRNLIDEGQFGAALILSPFNYDKAYAKGIEYSAVYNGKQWSGYFNFAYQKAKARHIISGQSLFGVDELAYIAKNDIYLDHDQTYTASSGASYKFGNSKISGDVLYGSGVRRTADGGTPNGNTLPDYAIFNLNVTHNWLKTPIGNIEARIALLNLFDKTYLLRDGTGVGVGAPQYGLRRGFYAGLATSF
jgi:outer membrane receptor protein involved in Fe transport